MGEKVVEDNCADVVNKCTTRDKEASRLIISRASTDNTPANQMICMRGSTSRAAPYSHISTVVMRNYLDE
eukprot:10745387-Prorocentrum_lima.AAC.1